jgi:hypothetical protein
LQGTGGRQESAARAADGGSGHRPIELFRS